MHVCIRVDKELTLALLIAFQVLQGNVIRHFFLAHLNVLLVRRGRPGASGTRIVIIWCERHYMAHVRLCEFFNGATTVTFALFIRVVDDDRVVALRILLLLVSCQDPHVHLVIALVAPVILRARQSLAK